jgi:DNA-directed RNA polymerase specialized sigma24 family protein
MIAPPPGLTPEEQMICVQIAIAQLPERDRETVLALYFEGLTLREAAKRFGLGRSAVWARMIRIRKRLLFRLEKLFKELEAIPQ